MSDFEYIITVKRRLKGTKHQGQGVYTWFIPDAKTINEVVDLLNKKIVGAPMPKLAIRKTLKEISRQRRT